MSLHFGDDVGKKKDKPIDIDDDVKGLDDDIEVDAAQRKKVLGFDEDDIDVKEEKADFHEAIKLSDALNGLVGKSLYSDCTFVVGKHGKEIHGHRVVLAASSRVFEAMLYPNSDFLADPSENREKLNKIVIPDVEPEVFLTLLRGIYTDKPELTEETVGGVIKAAKIYQLEKVQLACSLYLEDGVTKENALGLFNRAEELTGDPNLAMSFIEKWAGKLIEQPAFSALKKSRLEYLLKSDQLAVKEVELFKAVLRWGQAECKRQDLPNTTENVRKVLEDVIALIRFPTMNVIDLATQITPSQVLTQSETLELYQYLGAKDPSTGKSPMPTKFPTKGRVGGLVHDFVFDESRRGTNCALRENGRIVSGTAESYACVLGNKPLPTDHKTYWELRIVSNSQTGGSWRIAIGIATGALNLNSYLSEGPHGWAYFNQGCRCHQDGSGSNLYGGQYTTGAVIGVLFDPEKSTVSYYRDGKNLGPCWTNIPVKAQPLFPAVHVNAGVVVELIAPELTNVPQDEQ